MSINPADLDRGGLRLDIDDSRPAGCVATVTLNRPQRRNAMTPAMWHGLAAIGAGLPGRVRVVVVRGAGPSFSAGIDLRMFSAEGVPGEDPLPRGDDPGFEQWLAACQAGFHLAPRPPDRVRRRGPRSCHRRRLSARPVVRPAAARRRRPAVH